jgi:hypothetical protein
MDITAEVIAEMLTGSAAGMDFIEKRVAEEWEPRDPDKSLRECLDKLTDQYALFVNTEIGWDRQEKLRNFQTHINLALQPKRLKPGGEGEPDETVDG